MQEVSALERVAAAQNAQVSALLKEAAKLKADNGLVFYKPHDKQYKFHAHGDRKYRLVRTGNRWGKSQAGSAEDVSWCVGERLFLPESDPARYIGIPRRAVRGLVLVNDWGKAQSIFTNHVEGSAGLGKIFQYLPKSHFAGRESNAQGYTDKIKIKSNWGGISELCFDTLNSFMNRPLSAESEAWDFIHVDEPIPKDMWDAHSRGLIDSNGKAWFLCTPMDYPWINTFFIPSRRHIVDMGAGSEFVKNRYVIVGSSYDNPYNSKEGKEEFEATLTEENKLTRLHGIPSEMQGLIYKEFVPDEHIWDRENLPHGWSDWHHPPRGYTIRYSIDPHPSTPHAILFAATAPTGEVFFFHEFWKHTLIEDVGDHIREIIGNRHVETAHADPSAFILSPVDETCWADTWEEQGIIVEPAPKDLQGGIMIARSWLNKKTQGGKRLLQFSPFLAQLFFEFDNYVWDPKRPNKPKDENDHLLECFYRLCYTGLEYVRPPDEMDKRHFEQYHPVKTFDPVKDYFPHASNVATNSRLGL